MIKLYGLDEKINLAGRLTTIREQHQNKKVKSVVRNMTPGRGAEAAEYWAEIEKSETDSERFHISEVTYRYLRDGSA